MHYQVPYPVKRNQLLIIHAFTLQVFPINTTGNFFFLIFTLTYFVNNYSLLFVEFAPGLQKEKKKELTDKV